MVKVSSIEKLPVELLEMILNNLSFKERIKIRRVCKKFLSVVENSKIRSLYVCDEGKKIYIGRISNKYIDKTFENRIPKKHCELIIKNSRSSFAKSLKHLTILRIKSKVSASFFKVLHSLDNLEVLNVISCRLEDNLELSFRKLERIEFHTSRINKIRLKTPLLNYLRVETCEIQNLKLLHTDLINELFLDRFYSFLNEYSFNSLSYLYLSQVGKSSPQDQWLLKCQNLKEIHFRSNPDFFNRVNNLKLENNLDFKVFYFGVSLTDLNLYNRCYEYKENYSPILSLDLIDLYKRFYCKLPDHLYFYFELQYSHIEHLDDDLQEGFWKKLCNLNTIRITSHVKDEKRFLEFLKKFSSIKNLVILDKTLSQSLLDQLANSLASVNCISIQRTSNDDLLKYDLNFSRKFKNPLTILVPYKIQLNLIEQVLEQASFNFFSFRYKDSTMAIERLDTGEFRLIANDIMIEKSLKNRQEVLFSIEDFERFCERHKHLFTAIEWTYSTALSIKRIFSF